MAAPAKAVEISRKEEEEKKNLFVFKQFLLQQSFRSDVGSVWSTAASAAADQAHLAAFGLAPHERVQDWELNPQPLCLEAIVPLLR